MQRKIEVENMSKRMIVVFPSRNFTFSGIYNVTEDLHNGLIKEKIDHELILVIINKEFAEPNFECRKVILSNFKNIFTRSVYFLIPDDYELIDYLYDNAIYDYNIMIWSHYFKGHRMIFSEYNDKVKHKSLSELNVKFAHDFLPYFIWRRFVYKYVNYLKKNVLIAQSIWSCLLLNRVYSLNCQRIVSLPVDLKYFRDNNADENKALIFIGGKLDTDLNKLNHVLSIINEISEDIKYNVIGDQQIFDQFNKKSLANLTFRSNVSRADLQDLISKAKFTINPIFLGTFEMFPIESLMCGTPVITFIQPFLEVIGETTLVSYIDSDSDIISKFIKWKNDNLEEEKKRIKGIIKVKMNANTIAKNIYSIMEGEFS